MASQTSPADKFNALSAIIPGRDKGEGFDLLGHRQVCAVGQAQDQCRARATIWACCPFHGEKSPSFHCEDRKGRYHCFGCKVSGDIFTYLVEKEGVPFPEAVERLAMEAGLEMPKLSPEAEAREERRASLYDVMQMAQDFFDVTASIGGGGQGARLPV